YLSALFPGVACASLAYESHSGSPDSFEHLSDYLDAIVSLLLVTPRLVGSPWLPRLVKETSGRGNVIGLRFAIADSPLATFSVDGTSLDGVHSAFFRIAQRLA